MENLTIVIAIEWDFKIISCFFLKRIRNGLLGEFYVIPSCLQKTARFKSGQNLPKNNQLDSLIYSVCKDRLGKFYLYLNQCNVNVLQYRLEIFTRTDKVQ